MLQLSGVSKSFVTGKSIRQVLDNLSLQVNKGDAVAIVGPSGSGKTTLLNIIGTLEKADGGQVLLDGKNVMEITANELPTLRNQKIGMVFQLHHLLPQCTLWENVLLPTIPLKKPDIEYEIRAEQLLRRTGIWEQRFQKPTELSGGECQRAAVVRALMNQPAIVLADEPTGALDHENAQLLTNLLLELNKEQGTALIVVTHSMELASKMDRVYLLDNGKLVEKRSITPNS